MPKQNRQEEYLKFDSITDTFSLSLNFLDNNPGKIKGIPENNTHITPTITCLRLKSENNITNIIVITAQIFSGFFSFHKIFLL